MSSKGPVWSDAGEVRFRLLRGSLPWTRVRENALGLQGEAWSGQVLIRLVGSLGDHVGRRQSVHMRVCLHTRHDHSDTGQGRERLTCEPLMLEREPRAGPGGTEPH